MNIFRFWWRITSFPKAYIFIPTAKRSLRAAVIGPGAFWLSADYLFLDAKKYLPICSVGLRRSFGGRRDITRSPSDTRPPPSCPLRAAPRGCHGASLPWRNLSYWKENKWRMSSLLPTAAAPRFSSQGLVPRTCQKSIWKSTTAARGKGLTDRGEAALSPTHGRSNLLHFSLRSTLRKRLKSEFPLQHTSFYQPYFLWYFVNYNKFAFFWIFRCFKRYPKDAIRP